MSLHKISKFIHPVRRECSVRCTDMYVKRILKVSMRQDLLRRNVSNTNATQDKTYPWQSFIKRWEWCVPVGIGVSLLAVLQWRHLKKYPRTTETTDRYESISDVVMTFYCYLPLRIASRVWGWIASTELPVSLRPSFYGFYAKTFHANLDEVDLPLSDFPSLVDFFVRPLKDDARPIAQNTCIVSPSDGRILHFGPVTSCRVEQVKNMTYNLRNFLGDWQSYPTDKLRKFTKEEDDTYVKSLLKDPTNQLYQLTIYLAPGDYHRFHSPTDWEIDFRRHFQGKLLSVNPKIARYLPELFCLNERVVYIGKWAGGFMAYTAVGATNVGSIRVYCDKELHTNTIKWPEAKHWKDAALGCARMRMGEVFGEFRMGSTIVLLFEAPKDFQFNVKSGQAIKVGQALTHCFVRNDEKQREQQEHSL